MPHQPALPGINYSNALYPLIAIALLVFVVRWVSSLVSGGTRRGFPYRLRDGLLTPAELSFYGVLKLAVQERFTVCPKVRLADVFLVTNGDLGSLNKITSKHADFVLCEPRTMKPVLGIELDDSSHQAARRVQRDEFVDGVFRTARLPLLRVPVRQNYNPSDLQSLIQEALAGNDADEQAPNLSVPEELALPSCPACGVPMIVRTARQGPNKGSHFYGCPNYPECRQVESVPH